ncbi:sigma-54-dependent Fis family transcriptional regulator [Jatrophihabitans sp. YIM 134969]
MPGSHDATDGSRCPYGHEHGRDPLPAPAATADGTVLRPAISAAWHRAQMAGLRPDTHPDPDRAFEIEPDSRLLVAARPVLDQLAADLADTRFALILADRQSRVVDHRVGAHPLIDRLAEVGLVTGTVWDEENTGTNSVATVFELRRGLSVVGDEHYLDDLKQFCCYGEPLFDPTSGRLEGVLDITGPVADATSLLGPFLSRARHEIERRLLDTSRAAHQMLLRAYESATAGARHPVVAIGDDMMLANQAATSGLSRDDIAVLKALVASGTRGGTTVRLASGSSARVECSPVAPGSAVLRIRPVPARVTAGVGSGASGGVRRLPRRTNVSVLICGEAGTGRSAEAASRAGRDAVVFHAADEPKVGELAWSGEIRTALGAGQEVLVEDVHLLRSTAVTRLRSTVITHRGTGRLVATCAPLADLGPDHSALASLFDEHVTLRPLREDRGRIPRLVTAMLADLTGPEGPRPGAALVEHLAQSPWPGNLHELRKVVDHLALVRTRGELTVADLPTRYQQVPWQRALSPLERSEYETIVVALRESGGNKLQAARRLGISRGTLYSRMRRFKIPA